MQKSISHPSLRATCILALSCLTSLASLSLTDSAIAQPITGDNLTVNSGTPFLQINDVGAAGEFYEISPDTTYLNFHTHRTRTDAMMQPPLAIPWNAQPGLMKIGFFGVTIGANPPGAVAAAPLHVYSYGPEVDNSTPNAKIVVEDANPEAGVRTMIEMINKGGSRFGFTNSDTGRTWAFQNNASDGFLINLLGSGGNEMSIRKTGLVTMGPGGVQNFLLDPSGNLTILGTFNPASDRNLKENFADVDEQEILEKISTLPISTWQYKRDETPIRHIGPVAQDFHAAFEMGQDEKSISVTDASGVALAGIKALKTRCEDLQELADEKDDRIAELETQLAELAQRMTQLESQLPQ